MAKKVYSLETKLACIEMKKAGKSNKVIMDTLGIKNVSQVKTWIRMMNCSVSTNLWGNNITYCKGMEQLSEVEQLRLQVELLKKYQSLIRKSTK